MESYEPYIQKPNFHFPILRPQPKWTYIIDLDNDIVSVFLAGYGSRRLYLLNIPRWLFECAAASSSGPSSLDEKKHFFMGSVPRAHLPPCHVSVPHDPTALDYYQSCAPTVRPVVSFPGVETFTVRKHFRLVLLTIFYNWQLEMFDAREDHRSPQGIQNLCILAYSIINLVRSSVEVRIEFDPRSGARVKARGGQVARRRPFDSLPTTPECWIEDVLVILDDDILTKENLHAAIGKAIQLTAARARLTVKQTTPTERTRPAAVICSLTSVVLVYIRDGEVSHTPNLEFIRQYSSLEEVDTVVSDGLLALFDTFYRPPQLAEPQSFPGPYKHLPTEIAQLIFSHACPSTRDALESSCRLFHRISHDHGLRIADCYLQKRSVEDGRTAFVGERYVIPGKVWTKADPTYTGGRMSNYRRVGGYTSRTIMHLVGKVWPEADTRSKADTIYTGGSESYDRQVGKYTSRTIVHLEGRTSGIGCYRAFLLMPDSTIVKLEMPFIGAGELET